MIEPILQSLLLAWMASCAQVYGVDPHFAQAVAIVESRPAHGPELAMRCGRLGKSRYYGPMGIEKSFLKRWAINDPFVNIQVGVMALRGADKRRVLKRYNASFTEAYYREVRRIERRLKEG